MCYRRVVLPVSDLHTLESDIAARASRDTTSTGEGLHTQMVGIAFTGPWHEHLLAHVVNYRAYLDLRTGSALSIYFAGVVEEPVHEEAVKLPARQRRGLGGRFATWYWDPQLFDGMRRDVQAASDGAWRFSGGSDLLLAFVNRGDDGTVIIDWSSTVTLNLNELDGQDGRPWLGQLVEQLTQAVEGSNPDFSLEALKRKAEPTARPGDPIGRQVLRQLIVEAAKRAVFEGGPEILRHLVAQR